MKIWWQTCVFFVYLCLPWNVFIYLQITTFYCFSTKWTTCEQFISIKNKITYLYHFLFRLKENIKMIWKIALLSKRDIYLSVIRPVVNHYLIFLDISRSTNKALTMLSSTSEFSPPQCLILENWGFSGL